MDNRQIVIGTTLNGETVLLVDDLGLHYFLNKDCEILYHADDEMLELRDSVRIEVPSNVDEIKDAILESYKGCVLEERGNITVVKSSLISVFKEKFYNPLRFESWCFRMEEEHPNLNRINLLRIRIYPQLRESDPIIYAGFNIRTYNILLKNGFETIGDVALRSPDEFYEIRGIGDKTIEDIETSLYRFGIVSPVW